MDGQGRILLTGATGTLGAQLALQLCREGAELILPVRSADKGEVLRKTLLDACPKAQLSFPMLDLTSEASVHALADVLLAGRLPLDAIALNAGVFTKAGRTSPQGSELHMQVNCSSQLLLTRLLLPLLRLSPAPCVLAVTSLSAFWHREDEPAAGPTRLYAASKRALLTELTLLAKAEPGLCICYAHPGVCATGLFRGGETAYPAWLLRFALPVMAQVFPSPEQACRPILHALHHPSPGMLTEPGGLFRIWGRPASIPLAKRLKTM